MRSFSCALTVISMMATPVVALDDGDYDVWLEDSDGSRIEVASLQVQNGQYAMEMAEAPFTDHFLSMRPFRCIEGPQRMWCHVPYPYDIKRDISAEATDIEYDFLFVWKPSGEYGIDLWNGVYYSLAKEGAGMVGTMHEMDMNLLAVPPDAGNLRPISGRDLELADPDSHWLPVMRVLPSDG